MRPQQFVIGTRVTCNEGTLGELRRVVFNPVNRELTHLVVEPPHSRRAGRLVPLRLVEPSDQEIQLRCTRSEFEQLTEADEAQFLLQAGGALGYAPDQAYALPYFGLGLGAIDGGRDRTGRDLDTSAAPGPAAISYDRVPLGEVEIQRGDQLYAEDGPVGRVKGLVIDPENHHVTHVLLEEGHLWGAKEVAIPIGAVSQVADGVQTTLTKGAIRDLPPVNFVH